MFMILAPRLTPSGPPKFSTPREREEKPPVEHETPAEERTSA
jgi:hypothetical protein